MSYDARETSAQDARPRELYRFTMGTGVWAYTSKATPYTHNFETYHPLEIDRSEPTASREQGRSGIEVTAPFDLPLAQMFVRLVPHRPVGLTIFRLHETDGEVRDFWTGRVRSVERRGVEAVMRCEPNHSQFSRLGLRVLHQPTCNVPLYSRRCGVPKGAFRTEAAIQTIATDSLGRMILKAAAWIHADPTWFKGGMVERADGDLRTISDYTGTDALTLIRPFEDLKLGELVAAYAGCDHTFATCSSAKFAAYTDDGEAFAGFNTIPPKNIHETGLK